MKALLICAVLATGCYATGTAGGYYGGGGYYSAGYVAPAPSLVYVSPDVQVVADYDYPVFYSDNYYWRYDNGVWYRSSGYDGGWVIEYNVPYAVARIERPHTYVHYRGGTYYGNRGNGSYQRDHRAYTPPRARPWRAPARNVPTVRDHRR